jgi:broad specificity phosphatase PhoE
MRLYIVRHGQTAWNIEGKAQGHTDIPLDPTGQAQAAGLARAFEGVQLDRVISSDLLRAKETAEAFGLSVETRPDLRERSFGEWEGRDYVSMMNDLEARAEAAGVTRLHVRPPGGESFQDVWNRIGPFVEELKQAEDNTLVVCHGAMKAVLLARLMDGNLETCRAFRFKNCAVTEFERRHEGTLVMVRYAEQYA